jgi:hypothetical protein
MRTTMAAAAAVTNQGGDGRRSGASRGLVGRRERRERGSELESRAAGGREHIDHAMHGPCELILGRRDIL